MLPKKIRLNKDIIEKIFKSSRFVNSPSLTFKYILSKDNLSPKISFISPKTVNKKAVVRNRLRRKGYIALKEHLESFPLGLVGVFVFKKQQDDILAIENEIKTILTKIN